ncbi:MAG: hypothetical protein RL648_1194 [Verrucomicrobiota bacterium]
MCDFGFHRPRDPKGALALFLVGVLPCLGGAAFQLEKAIRAVLKFGLWLDVDAVELNKHTKLAGEQSAFEAYIRVGNGAALLHHQI